MQTQKMTLSKREKKLLFMAGCVGFLAIMIILVILPLNNRLMDNNLLHSELAARQAEIELELATEPQIRGNHATALANFEQIRTTHNNEALASEIGLMLTQKVTQHNLEPISQNISQPQDFVVPNNENQNEAIFRAMSVTMVVAGEYNEVRNLLNTIEDIQYLRVSNINLRFSRENAREAERITLRFDLLMLREDLLN